jgi:hypothetical protein
MADLYQALYPAAQLSAVARLMLADEDRASNQFQLAQWFPNTLVPAIRFKWTTGTSRTYTNATPFRAFQVPARILTRPGRSRRSGEMPPLSNELELLEFDEIVQNSNSDPDLAEAIQGDVFNNIDLQLRSIENRLEIVRADALVNGTCVLAENGLSLTVDWLRDPTRASTVAIPWATSATAVPLTNEQTVIDFMTDNEGMGPNDMVAMMNRVTYGRWRNTAQVQASFPSFRLITQPLTPAQANQVRMDNDLPAIVINDSRTNNADGTNRKLIPDGKVVYLPRGRVVGQTQWGITAVSTQAEVNLLQDNRPGPVVYQTRQLNPFVLSTVCDAIGFPVFVDTDSTYVLTT